MEIVAESKIEILDPMMDLVFKALFAKKDETSKSLLMALLNDILDNKEGENIVDIVHENPFNYKEFEGDKLSILDLKVTTDKGEIINIEIQVRKDDNYRKRSLFYWSKSYGDAIKEAEEYDKLKKTIMINILGYTEIVESVRLHTVFRLMEEKEYFTLLDDLEIHYLELTKLPNKEINQLNKTEKWIMFLKEAGREDSRDRIKELTRESDIMATALNKLKEISADQEMRALYKARQKARHDLASKLQYARREGREEEKIKTAKNLLKMNLTIEQIAQATELNIEEIKKLKDRIDG